MKTLLKVAPLLFALLWFSMPAQALPPQVEADLLMKEIGEAMKAGRYEGLSEKFQRVAELRVNVPETFEFHWGKTLYQSKDYEGALLHLDRYLSKSGSNGKFYTEALGLYSKAKESDAPRQLQEKLRSQLAEYTARGVDFGNGKAFRDCPTCPEMVLIPAGSFEMGSNDGDKNEQPVHTVRIGIPFAIGKTEVTKKQWRDVMGSYPPKMHLNTCDDCPVSSVSWVEAQEFIVRLNQRTGKRYRLPSEAEWEYACRAGETHIYCGSNNADLVAWYGEHPVNWYGLNDKDPPLTRPVAGKQPNAWGLYDMSGNVREWVEDCAVLNDYKGAPSDGSALTKPNGCLEPYQVIWIRGGSWRTLRKDVKHLRATHRGSDYNYPRNENGFRLARTLP